MITVNSPKRPLYTNAHPFASGPATTYNRRLEMPVNPLSVILLRIRFTNLTAGTATGYLDACTCIQRLELIHRGTTILSMSGLDAAMLNYLRWNILPDEANATDAINARRDVTLPIILGTAAYDMASCFPATKRGDLYINLTVLRETTALADVQVAVDTIELLGANPKEFERRTTISQQISATGDFNLELTPSLPNRGILLFSSQGYVATDPTLRTLKLTLDNQELIYSSVDWTALAALPSLWGRVRSLNEHQHTASGVVPTIPALARRFNYLNFDLTYDDAYTIDTKAVNRFMIRGNAGVTGDIRAIQMEVMSPETVSE